jgi:hypothetical protein
MTASQLCKSVHFVRGFSASHDRARQDLRQPAQIVAKLIEFNASPSSFGGLVIVAQLVASARFKSVSSPAAPKSP